MFCMPSHLDETTVNPQQGGHWPFLIQLGVQSLNKTHPKEAHLTRIQIKYPDYTHVHGTKRTVKQPDLL